MDNQLQKLTTNSLEASQVEDMRINLQNFLVKLNNTPSPDSMDKTADGRANTILISHIEMLLDEYFFGLWETENFKWSVIANEVVGSLDLCFYHPTAGIRMKRTGAAAIQIMVDKGANPLDVNAKKSNALDMGFPKLKAECLKNAANSLGKLFGRDINRKKQDNYKPLINKKEGLDKKLQQLKQPENV